MTARPQTSGALASADDVERLLRAASLRVTGPRTAVLRAVRQNPHADTETLIAATRELLPSVSHQTVYDVLRALTAAGLARRIQPAGSTALYEIGTGADHHHAVCRDCGAIADVPSSDVGPLPPAPRDDAGYLIEWAEVFYWGRCPVCAAD